MCAQSAAVEPRVAEVAANLAAVRQRLAFACQAAGRSLESVQLIAISKRQPLAALLAAYAAGVRDFGENTAQELADKAAAMRASGHAVRWHFVGHLQRNKVKSVVRDAAVVHTVDRPELVAALAQRVAAAAPASGEAQLPLAVLLQVNIGREAQKGGIEPTTTAVLALAAQVAARPELKLGGLMAIPPAGVDPSPYFAQLAELSQQLQARDWGRQATALSMGMSDDFPLAIRAGATMVRVGTAIFGARSTL